MCRHTGLSTGLCGQGHRHRTVQQTCAAWGYASERL